MRREWVRGLGLLGVLSGYVLPITIVRERGGVYEAFLLQVPGRHHTFLDTPMLAAVIGVTAAIIVGASIYDVRRENEVIPWVLLLGGVTIIVAVFRYPFSLDVPNEGTFAIGTMTVLGGTFLLFGSVVEEFHARVEPRWRDLVCLAGFGLVFASLPFPWYRNVEPIAANSNEPDQFTGSELVVSGIEIWYPIALAFALYLVVLLLRYSRERTHFQVGDRTVSYDVLLGLCPYLAMAVIHYARIPEFTTDTYRLQLHAQIARYSLFVAVGGYVAPVVKQYWDRLLAGQASGSDSG